MASFKTHCDICPSTFNTSTALLRHRETKHSDSRPVQWLPFYRDEQIVKLPTRGRRGRRSSVYKQWLGGIVESINSTLHPKASAKWCRVERFDVPEEFVQNILADMSGTFLNSVKEKRHLRPPLWKDTSLVLSYKTFDIDDVVAALSKQSGVEFISRRSYDGEREITAAVNLRGKDALEAAKARAHGFGAELTPTLQAQIVVGYGEGRATREFELIWWPDMFSCRGHGKLVLRFYVAKITI